MNLIENNFKMQAEADQTAEFVRYLLILPDISVTNIDRFSIVSKVISLLLWFCYAL